MWNEILSSWTHAWHWSHVNNTMDNTNINDDIIYSCSADTSFKQEVVDDLRYLNDLVNNLSLCVLIQLITESRKIGPTLAPDASLLETVLRFELTAQEVREYVALYLLRDTIFGIIYDNYFRSEFYFLGVPLESLRANLDCMVLELVVKGMFFIFIFIFIFLIYTMRLM